MTRVVCVPEPVCCWFLWTFTRRAYSRLVYRLDVLTCWRHLANLTQKTDFFLIFRFRRGDNNLSNLSTSKFLRKSQIRKSHGQIFENFAWGAPLLPGGTKIFKKVLWWFHRGPRALSSIQLWKHRRSTANLFRNNWSQIFNYLNI